MLCVLFFAETRNSCFNKSMIKWEKNKCLIKKALSEAQEQLNARCEQIKSQVLEVKVQVKSTAKVFVLMLLHLGLQKLI